MSAWLEYRALKAALKGLTDQQRLALAFAVEFMSTEVLCLSRTPRAPHVAPVADQPTPSKVVRFRG